jgi:formylglycine-generating enzyme required for sulfatase activity
VSIVAVFAISGVVRADTFGSGTNQFTIDFVPISGATNPTSGTWTGSGFTFTGVANDYRMGTYEISNDQWNKFKASLGVPVTGSPSTAYDSDPCFTGTNVPTNNVSWYEATQFVNYLNTSTNHQAAYKFTGTQGTGNYTFTPWDVTDAGYSAANPYRNSNAIYFMPTENEWLKAAYWNGTSLQTYATIGDVYPTQGNGTNGGWNYYAPQAPAHPYGPWAVTSGSQELNGTYNMMGNVLEWTESPWMSTDYLSGSDRSLRGGWFSNEAASMASSTQYDSYPDAEGLGLGFRVASVPEPCSLILLLIGGAVLRNRKR